MKRNTTKMKEYYIERILAQTNYPLAGTAGSDLKKDLMKLNLFTLAVLNPLIKAKKYVCENGCFEFHIHRTRGGVMAKPLDIIRTAEFARCDHCKPGKNENFACMFEEGYALTSDDPQLTEMCTIEDWKVCPLNRTLQNVRFT